MGIESFVRGTADMVRGLWSAPIGREERAGVFDFSRGLFPFFSWDSTTGEAVTPESAMRIATVYSCVTFRAESVGMLPIKPFTEIDGTKQINKKHPVYNLITCRPNPWMNAGHFWKLVVQIVDLKGNCYVKISRDPRGRPIRLDILNSYNVDLRVNEELDEPFYFYKGKQIASTDILHFKHFTADGKLGISMIGQHLETFGSARKLRKFANRSLNAIPPIYAQTQQPMPTTQEGKQQFQEFFRKEMGSFFNNGTVPVLWNGVDLKSVGLSPADAAYLDQIAATKEDIYGIFKVNQILINAAQRVPGVNNYEQINLQYLIYTLSPLLKMIEEECNEKLFTVKEQESSFVKFNTRALMLTDHKTQAEWFKSMWGIGVYSQNDIRNILDENPIDDGDRYYIPVNNMMPTDMVEDYFSNQEEAMPMDKETDTATGEDDTMVEDGETETKEKKKKLYSLRELLSRKNISFSINGHAVEQ